MRILTEYLLALVDLVEAEGRSLRASVIHLAVVLIVLAAVGLMILAGCGLLIASVYLLIAGPLPHWAAAMITGGALVVLGSLAVLIVRKVEQ